MDKPQFKLPVVIDCDDCNVLDLSAKIEDFLNDERITKIIEEWRNERYLVGTIQDEIQLLKIKTTYSSIEHAINVCSYLVDNFEHYYLQNDLKYRRKRYLVDLIFVYFLTIMTCTATLRALIPGPNFWILDPILVSILLLIIRLTIHSPILYRKTDELDFDTTGTLNRTNLKLNSNHQNSIYCKARFNLSCYSNGVGITLNIFQRL